MKEAHLIRWAYTPVGTFGTLKVDAFECYTVERPWKLNLPNVSCIPTGAYVIKPGTFYQDKKRGPYADYELQNVPMRTEIDIHIGNTMLDVKGCVVLGKRLGMISNKWAVLDSAVTFAKFMRAMGGEDGVLIVRNAPEFATTWKV